MLSNLELRWLPPVRSFLFLFHALSSPTPRQHRRPFFFPCRSFPLPRLPLWFSEGSWRQLRRLAVTGGTYYPINYHLEFHTSSPQPWITPSLFDVTGDSRIIDEWTFCQYQERTVATSVLQAHWNTWITELDFSAIAAAGYITFNRVWLALIFLPIGISLNHVRLPIGYWAFDVSDGEPFIQGQVTYLQRAVTWAQNHGLKLIIDLHGPSNVHSLNQS